jgi:two-component system, sensor histidine kinase and response regulator
MKEDAASKETATILIVDDERSMRDSLESMLTPDGYTFWLAANAAAALKLLEKQVPDVMLLDVMMPEQDGFDLCRQIKADPRLSHVPAVMVTALDTKEDLVRGLEAGADEFVTKPVTAVELRARVRSMLRIKRQHDRLKATLKLREELADMIVHDMRAPLNVITLHAEALANLAAAEPTPPWKERADALVLHSDRLNSFINDLLLLAKLEAGRLVLNRAAVDVVGFVRAKELEYRALAQERRLTTSVELPEKGRYLMLDPTLFGRVVDNLLSNAIKYSRPGDGIRIVLTPLDDEARRPCRMCLEIQDQGPGIPDADKERVFDKFQIVDQKRKGVTQIGLGLSFSKLAVEAHGGRIAVRDNQPRGSIFTVEI